MKLRLLLLSILLCCTYWSSEAQERVLLYLRSCPLFGVQTKEITTIMEQFEQGKLKTPEQWKAVGITSISDQGLTYRTSTISQWSLRILPYDHTSQELLVTIETIKEPRVDSRLSFYSTIWEVLPTETYFLPPTVQDFIPKGLDTTSAEGQRLMQLLSPLYLLYSLDTHGNLQVQAKLLPTLEDQTNEALNPWLKKLPTLHYRWDKKEFICQS